jgi:hypothetical protein
MFTINELSQVIDTPVESCAFLKNPAKGAGIAEREPIGPDVVNSWACLGTFQRIGNTKQYEDIPQRQTGATFVDHCLKESAPEQYAQLFEREMPLGNATENTEQTLGLGDE